MKVAAISTAEFTISVPPRLVAMIDEVVRAHAQRTGEAEEDVRRGVEIAIVTEGVRVVKEGLAR